MKKKYAHVPGAERMLEKPASEDEARPHSARAMSRHRVVHPFGPAGGVNRYGCRKERGRPGRHPTDPLYRPPAGPMGQQRLAALQAGF